jgi:hypothetical protein
MIYAFLSPGLLALVGGLWSGLLRLPVPFVPASTDLVLSHGLLMIPGFLGTVIAVERAAALGKPWTWLVPGLNGAATLLVLAAGIAGLSGLMQTGVLLLLLASLGYLLLYVPILKMQPSLFNVEMAHGGVALLLGNLAWLQTGTTWSALPGWLGFLLLTIAGERLELNRLLKPSPAARRMHLAILVLLLVSIVSAQLWELPARRLFAHGILLMAVWLAFNDVARRTIRLAGLAKYSAICLLAGYAWLCFSGMLWLMHPEVRAGLIYDAVLHSFLVGFVMSMIFGHAPIILPALTRRQLPNFKPLYVPFGLLHFGLVIRLLGDLATMLPLRQVGGTINVLAVLMLPPMLVALSKPADRKK